jgi:hypothetical protein
MTGAEAHIPRAFADAEIGDRLEWIFRSPIGGPVSNPEGPISGICPWSWPRAVCGSRRPVRTCLEDPVQVAEWRRADGLFAWARAPFIGSGEPELLFLFRLSFRQIAGEPGDGQIGRGPTLGDRFDDAWGEIGERRERPARLRTSRCRARLDTTRGRA